MGEQAAEKGVPTSEVETARSLGVTCFIAEGCAHEWADRGTPGDRWRECWLCGKQEDTDPTLSDREEQR